MPYPTAGRTQRFWAIALDLATGKSAIRVDATNRLNLFH
jgi:hypothetical protein